MKAIIVFLMVALLLVGVAATALPTLSAWSQASQHAVPVLSISPDPAPSVFIACDPSPCDCPGGSC